MKKHHAAGAVIAAGALGATLFAAPAEAASAVQITRVYYNSPGTDTGSNWSLNGEWVQLTNHSSWSRQLRGYTLRDRAGFTYTFGWYVLGGHRSVVVHTGQGADNQGHRYWDRTWYVWNNTGDTAYLRYPGGALADSCSWGSTGSWRYC